MKCYNIENQNDYFMKLSKSVDIEDAGDCFITQAEMKEMGLKTTYYGLVLYEKKAKAAIRMWIKQIPPGGKSVVCTDDDLIEALKEYFLMYGEGVNDILGQRGKVGGIVRSGNKFMIKAKAKAKPIAKGKKDPRLSDWFKLMDLAKTGLAANHIFISGGTLSKEVPDRQQTLISLKKVVRWYDMVAANKTISDYYNEQHATEEQMSIIKRMWWNPSLVIDFKTGRKK